jgi:uncharacterized protein with ParB-like and HNH nuclease domain
MKAGKYNIKDFFINRYVDQVIIPEIQRDYVWGEDQVTGLLDSICNDFNKYNNLESPVSVPNDKELEDSFLDFYKRRISATNIGFIYAYNDEEYQGKYFLIDGQQRITTIFLLLLVLARNNEDLTETFKKTYLEGDTIKLDYKVREAAHTFLSNFVPFVLTNNDSVLDQSWYFEEYDDDVTIRSLYNNFKLIQAYLEAEEINENAFYHYIEEYTEFWYFDTNISEQGEELYIYMNARGEQVEANENIKADLLSKLNTNTEKNRFGKLWEDWQDFFWKHKGRNNINADKGFNDFLACIAGLQYYDHGIINFYSPQKFKDSKGVKTPDLLAILNIADINKYITGLIYLEENKEQFCSEYEYAGWVDKAMGEIWTIFNSQNTNWFADYNDDDRATERSRMVFLWSVFYYFSKVDLATAKPTEVFRLLRLYYVRFKNFNRSVTTIKSTIYFITELNGVLDYQDNLLPKDISSKNSDNTDQNVRTLEERFKARFLNKFIVDEAMQKQAEAMIWEIEDHKFNIDGSDVGGINISHLVDFNSDLTYERLSKIKSKFYEIFPPDVKYYETMQNILLHYGEFWYRDSPFYYFNYRFDNWRRIIRDRGVVPGQERSTFKNFWNEFLDYDESLDNLLRDKLNIPVTVNQATDLRTMLLWYNQYIGDAMWQQGNYIAFSNGDYCGLPDYWNMDAIFKEHYIFYNTKGDLKGGIKVELSQILPISI